jgi:hypothetical protein
MLTGIRGVETLNLRSQEDINVAISQNKLKIKSGSQGTETGNYNCFV